MLKAGEEYGEGCMHLGGAVGSADRLRQYEPKRASTGGRVRYAGNFRVDWQAPYRWEDGPDMTAELVG